MLELHIDLTLCNICFTGTPDSFPAKSSEPCVSTDIELDRSSIIVEFSTANIFRHSPLGDVLNSLKNLSLAGDSQPNYVRFELEADNGEFRFPPATHFIATVEDLTYMVDYGSKDIDSMDNDTEDEKSQNPPFTRRWTATSSYDMYMMDTPKEDNDDGGKDPHDKPAKAPLKRRRQRR